MARGTRIADQSVRSGAKVSLHDDKTIIWQDRVLRALADLLVLPADADVEWRAIRPSIKAYKAAVDLISEVAASTATLPIPSIGPDREGGIQIEFEKGKYALEIAVLPNGGFEILKVTPSEQTENLATFSRAKESISWLARA